MLYDGECGICMKVRPAATSGCRGRSARPQRMRPRTPPFPAPPHRRCSSCVAATKKRIDFVDIAARDYTPADNAGLTYAQVREEAGGAPCRAGQPTPAACSPRRHPPLHLRAAVGPSSQPQHAPAARRPARRWRRSTPSRRTAVSSPASRCSVACTRLSVSAARRWPAPCCLRRARPTSDPPRARRLLPPARHWRAVRCSGVRRPPLPSSIGRLCGALPTPVERAAACSRPKPIIAWPCAQPPLRLLLPPRPQPAAACRSPCSRHTLPPPAHAQAWALFTQSPKTRPSSAQPTRCTTFGPSTGRRLGPWGGRREAG